MVVVSLKTLTFFSKQFAVGFLLWLIAAHAVVGQSSVADSRHQKEIDQLYKISGVRKALLRVRETESTTIATMITLSEIPAPPFHEQARGLAMATLLQQAGADSVWTDHEGNVLALRRGTKRDRTVVVEGHLDTVFPETVDVTVQPRGDTLRGPGIGDNARGLAMVLTLLRVMHENNLRTSADILFGATVGEEGLGDLRGVKALFNNPALSIDAYITLDVHGTGTIVYGGVGSKRYRLKVKGPGGHSFGEFGRGNAHHALARIIHYFVLAADPYTRDGVPTTYNVGIIGGGSSVNAIPAESWLEIDLRSESPERLAVLDTMFQAAITRGLDEENKQRRRGGALTSTLQTIGDRPVGVQSHDLPLIRRAIVSAERLGITPTFEMISTNANLPISRGIPAVCLGIGGQTANAHALNEWWLNDNGYLAVQHALLVLLAEAGMK